MPSFNLVFLLPNMYTELKKTETTEKKPETVEGLQPVEQVEKPQEKVEVVKVVESEAKIDSKQYKILIAEDEVALANALALKLKSVGYVVDVAQDGQEALDLIQKNSYDLFLLDLLMPKKDGFEVLKAVKDFKHPPIIVLSNLSQEEDIKRTKDLGAIDFWIKSNFQLSQIVSFLKDYFEKK